MSGPERTYTFGFAVEHSIGHITFANRLRAAVERDPAVRAHWVLVEPVPRGRAEELPLLNRNYTVYTSLHAWRNLRRVEHELDGLLIHTQTIAAFSPRLMRRVPTVISTDGTPKNIDEISGAYAHRTGSPVEEHLKRRVVARTFRSAARVVPWSDWVRHSLTADYGVPASNVVAIRPGIDLDRWRAPERAEQEQPTRLLFVGGHFERKGGDVLLRALDDLRGDWQLDVVTKDDVPSGPRLVVHSDLEPQDPRLEGLYRQADLFVLPTLGDTYGWALLEAMAAGLPVVSTRVGAIPEIVEDGRTGILVPTNDPGALRQRLQELIDDPDRRQALGKQARSYVEETHDGLVNSQALLDLMKAVARRPR